MAKEKLQYFQFEPMAFLSDIDYQSMTAAERGCYCTIIFYMYANGGRCENDLASLARICNVSASFDFTFILKKFTKRNGFLFHKRVTAVIKRTQTVRNKKVKAANKRWSTCNAHASVVHEMCNANEKRSESEEKKRNISNSNSKEKTSDDSNSLRGAISIERLKANQVFAVEFDTAMPPRSHSDRRSREKITAWLGAMIEEGKFTDKIYNRVLDMARECRREGRNPWAYFLTAIQRELEYDPEYGKELMQC